MIKKNKGNNFDIIRLVAASLVIVSHEFGFFNMTDPLTKSTSLSLGTLGVYVFFAISGYLITKSYLRMPIIQNYLINRTLRIYPGLIVCILLTMFIFGPILTESPLTEYFTSPETYSYLWNLSLMKLSYYLPGVLSFDTGQNVINPPLWTLVFEFAMYISVIFLVRVKIFNTKYYNILIITLLISAIITISIGIKNDFYFAGFNVNWFLRFFTVFFLGSLFYVNQSRFKLFGHHFIVIGILWYFSIDTFLFFAATILLVLHGTFYFGLYVSPFAKWITTKGDFSYGFYIYGFLIQQVVFEIFGTSLGLLNTMLLSIISVIPFAVLSWNLIESKSLKLKKTLLTRPKPH